MEGKESGECTSFDMVIFEEALLGRFFPRELREAKTKEFLNLKQDSMIFQEYNLKFTQLSLYALEMVVDMRKRISLNVSGLGRSTKTEGRGDRLIEDMDIGRLMTYVQQTEDEKLRHKEEDKNKKAKTASYKSSKK